MIGCLACVFFGTEIGGTSEEKKHPVQEVCYDVIFMNVLLKALLTVKTRNPSKFVLMFEESLASSFFTQLLYNSNKLYDLITISVATLAHRSHLPEKRRIRISDLP